MVNGCANTTEKGAFGRCGMHYMRFKRYGDVNYITPESLRRELSRAAQPKLGKCKPNTYKKYLGRHEHRYLMEKKLGRKLLRSEHVHHIDGNKHNNSLDNLIVLSDAEHGRQTAREVNKPGYSNRNCKLTYKQALFVKKSKLPQAEAAKKLGVSKATISNIRNNKVYRDVK